MYVEPPTGHYMSPDRPPAGVGGWLAFFVIVTVFASGFSLIANLGSLVGDTGALVNAMRARGEIEAMGRRARALVRPGAAGAVVDVALQAAFRRGVAA